MSDSTDDDRRELVAALQALVDRDALIVLGQLAAGPQTGEALTAQMKRRYAAGRGPLVRLSERGLIRATADGTFSLDEQALYRLAGGLQRLSRDLFADKRVPTPADQLAWLSESERRELATCFVGEQIVEQLPPTRTRRLELLLHWLAEHFEPERAYHEREVNAIIKRYHADSAALRRYMIDFGLMERDHEIYRRT